MKKQKVCWMIISQCKIYNRIKKIDSPAWRVKKL